MATIPRTYLTTSKNNLNNIALKNGQVISIWDSDEVYYDVPANGTPEGTPVRRKISGVRVINTLPASPMTDILYIYLPSGVDGDLRIWLGSAWEVVGTKEGGNTVKSTTSNSKFYFTGTTNITDGAVTQLVKNSGVYYEGNTIHGNLAGNATTATTANIATSANTAAVATKAINDNATSPKAITGYVYDLSSNAQDHLGSTITITLGDGTTKTIRVSDTTYNTYTSSVAGLVPGTNTTVLSDTSHKLLSGDGWIDIDNLSLPDSESAIKDGDGNVITTTYYADADITGHTLTLTKGDGTTSDTFTLPDTTYNVFTSGANGLVPAASGTGTSGKFLRGDATWQNPADAIGTYQGSTPGLVPAAGSGNTGKYLRNDGAWGGTFDTNGPGLVPAPLSSSATQSLKSNGTWSDDIDTKNTAGTTNDTTHQLYLVGATEQSSNPQTYSNQNVYISNSKLYQSNGVQSVQVVDVSSTQNLLNKTFGASQQSLASLAFMDASPTVTAEPTNVQDEFTGDGTTTDFVLTYTPIEITTVTVGGVTTTAYTLDTVTNSIQFTAAPSSSVAIEVDYVAPDPTYDVNGVPTNDAVIDYVDDRLADVQDDIAYKTDITVVADIYDPTASYSANDYCMYDDGNGAKLYICTGATTGSWDSTKWVATQITDISGGGGGSSTLAGLSDVTITSATQGQVLTYDGSGWVNGAGGSGSSTLAGLSDVTITSVVQGDILKYNSTSGKWENTVLETVATGTLVAGSTSLTIQDAAITTSSTIDFYTDVYGVTPLDMTVTIGQIVFTFVAQSTNVGVKVVIK